MKNKIDATPSSPRPPAPDDLETFLDNVPSAPPPAAPRRPGRPRLSQPVVPTTKSDAIPSAPPPPPTIGRPPQYVLTEEIENEIIDYVTNGGLLSHIEKNNGKYTRHSIEKWVKQYPIFAEKLHRARELGADAIAEDILRFIDQYPATIVERGNERIDPGYVQWQRNRAEFRLRLLAMWFPKRYSARAGSMGDGSISVSIVTGVPGVGGDAGGIVIDGVAAGCGDKCTS